MSHPDSMPTDSRDPLMADRQDDPFITHFLSRVPQDVRGSFTDAQLDAVKLAFGARGWGRHRIDIRRSLSTPFGRHYVVFLVGRERRPPHRWLQTRIGRVVAALILVGMGVIFLLSLAGVVYTAKMALGIDVFPDLDMLPDQEFQQFLN